MEKNQNQNKKTSIGLTVGLGLLGLFQIWKTGYHFPMAWILCLLVIAVGRIRPQLLLPVHNGAMVLAHLISWIISIILLGGLYFLIMTPIGMLKRLFGAMELVVDFPGKVKSDWHMPTSQKLQDYEQQF